MFGKLTRFIQRMQRRWRMRKWRKSLGYKHLPHFLTIEVTTKCNANCTYCGRDTMKKYTNMPLVLYKEIIDACPFAELVVPQGIGEPLLHPDIVEMVRYTREKGHRVMFYTNASLLSSQMSRELIEAGLNRLVFSVDAHNRELYEKIRRGLKWDEVENNIMRFHTLRDLLGGKTKTAIRICEIEENREMMDEIVEFWSEIVDEVIVKPLREFPQPSNLWPRSETRRKCKQVNEEMVVKVNGDLVLCCEDWASEFVFGNVRDGPLRVFNNPAANWMRERVHSCGIQPYLCAYCINTLEGKKNELVKVH